jgi:hypothetical protein
MNDKQLDDAISNLTQQLTPVRELWPDIERRLTARAIAKKTTLWPWATAAMLGLVSLIGWQLALLSGDNTDKQAGMQSAELMLLQVYEQQKASQFSHTVAFTEGYDNWQQQMQVWDQAIDQVRRALQFYPDEPQLLAQLQQLYQQQLSYLQQATLQQPVKTS